ncbi:hypothetical protein F9K75_09385 [Brucella intermedia]|nr:hypothetical protein F9K75_09385 [Brucella intermedia]
MKKQTFRKNIEPRAESLNQKASGRGENGDFRVPERSVLKEIREHRNTERRHLQTGTTTVGTGSYIIAAARGR